jgi:hypothetical protein
MRGDKEWTHAEMLEQVALMHPGGYRHGVANTTWLLNVGKGAGMLALAIDRIVQLEHENAMLRQRIEARK